MKRTLGIILLILMMIVLSGCTGQQGSLSESKAKELEVIKKFKNERDVIGTGKFIEDSHNLYRDSIIISAIYNYNNALECNEFAQMSEDGSWANKAKMYASKIPYDYQGEFRKEMDNLISELLGDNLEAVKEQVESEEEKFNKLNKQDKKEIKDYINSRYDHYDEVEGGYAGDKYTKTIWEETSSKFDIPSRYIDEIWMDSDL